MLNARAVQEPNEEAQESPEEIELVDFHISFSFVAPWGLCFGFTSLMRPG